MICRTCGEILEDNARTCPICGTRQTAGAGTTINPTHSGSDDCAHQEEHKKPRKRRGMNLTWLVPLILPLFFFASQFLSPQLGSDSNKVITAGVVVLLLAFFVRSIITTLRRKK